MRFIRRCLYLRVKVEQQGKETGKHRMGMLENQMTKLTSVMDF